MSLSSSIKATCNYNLQVAFTQYFIKLKGF